MEIGTYRSNSTDLTQSVEKERKKEGMRERRKERKKERKKEGKKEKRRKQTPQKVRRNSELRMIKTAAQPVYI